MVAEAETGASQFPPTKNKRTLRKKRTTKQAAPVSGGDSTQSDDSVFKDVDNWQGDVMTSTSVKPQVSYHKRDTRDELFSEAPCDTVDNIIPSIGLPHPDVLVRRFRD